MMLNILSILKHIHDGIQNADPRYTVQDDEHILDTKSGVLLHVYDSWFKITYDGSNIITKDDFTEDEQSQFWAIKKLITTPEKLKEMEDKYKPLQLERRKRMSELFENPTPVNVLQPTAEEGATAYAG